MREHDETLSQAAGRAWLSADMARHSVWPCTPPCALRVPSRTVLLTQLSCRRGPGGSGVSARDCREECQSQAYQCFSQNKRGGERSGRSSLVGWFGLVLLKTQKCSFFDRNLILSRGYVPCLHAKLQMAYSLIPDICMYSSYSQRSEVSPTKAHITHYFFFSEKNSLMKYIKIHV